MKREKPFKFDICDYSSSYKGSSTKHIASVHNAKKSFKCDICDHSFSKKSNLKKHIGKVHEIKKHFTYNQSYLQKESRLKSYLKRHILSVHDEKTNYSNAVFVKHWF